MAHILADNHVWETSHFSSNFHFSDQWNRRKTRRGGGTEVRAMFSKQLFPHDLQQLLPTPSLPVHMWAMIPGPKPLQGEEKGKSCPYSLCDLLTKNFILNKEDNNSVHHTESCICKTTAFLAITHVPACNSFNPPMSFIERIIIVSTIQNRCKHQTSQHGQTSRIASVYHKPTVSPKQK